MSAISVALGPPCAIPVSTMPAVVDSRAQSLCSSHKTPVQFTGFAPACSTRRRAASCAATEVPATASTGTNNLKSVAHCIDSGEGEADLGPECAHDQLLAVRSFYSGHEFFVFPGVDAGSIYPRCTLRSLFNRRDRIRVEAGLHASCGLGHEQAVEPGRLCQATTLATSAALSIDRMVFTCGG